MKYLFYILSISLVSIFISCNGSGNNSNDSAARAINTTISVDDFESKLLENPQLIDVRTPEEFSEGHLKGAVNFNINADDFETEIAKLDKHKPVLVYCLSGGRSSSAAEVMGENGFMEVYNLQGGIMKWNAANKPLENAEVNEVTQGMSLRDFNKLIINHKFVLVDYNAKWCKPCIKMAPMLDSIAFLKKEKLSLVKIDADENKGLLKEKGIESLPVLELYNGGKLIWSHNGEIDKTTLLKETKL
ncbi:MAG: thioredoxin domain-containing protein [Bacteroidota bacterium]|nr:thioredoxin domain-containing protein [Bacteroidota bacterium]